jgi:hypothetical protein
MDQDIRDAFDALDKRLDKLEKAAKPGAGAATFGGKSAPKYPGDPGSAPKLYQAWLDKAGGNLKEVALFIRQRVAGFPESSVGIVGSLDQKPEEKAAKDQFLLDHPELFGK